MVKLLPAAALSCALMFAACHRSDAPPPKQPENKPDIGENEAPEPEPEKHEHDFPAQVGAFHDLMSPLWHAEAGPDRQKQTCDAVDKMAAAARDIEAAVVPEKAAAAENEWHEATAALTVSLEQLAQSCGAGGDFTADFKAVHDKFHELVALIGHEDAKN